MNMKKLNLKTDQDAKQIKNLSQFAEFYSEDGCSEKNDESNRINAKDFNSLYKAKPTKILLIDVRESEEFSTSAIEGSISIPLSTLYQESSLEFIQKESFSKEIFTICQSGKRSEKASRRLSELKICLKMRTFIKAMNIVRGIMKLILLKLMTLIVYIKQNPTKFF